MNLLNLKIMIFIKNMLFNRIKNAKKKLGIEEKLILEKENELGTVNNEEVIIGQDYIDDNSDYDRERPDLGECVPRKDMESPNGLDPDEGILLNDEETIKRFRLFYKSYYKDTDFAKMPINKITASDCEDFFNKII